MCSKNKHQGGRACCRSSNSALGPFPRSQDDIDRAAIGNYIGRMVLYKAGQIYDLTGGTGESGLMEGTLSPHLKEMTGQAHGERTARPGSERAPQVRTGRSMASGLSLTHVHGSSTTTLGADQVSAAVRSSCLSPIRPDE